MTNQDTSPKFSTAQTSAKVAWRIIAVGAICVVGLTAAVQHNGFFWDNILLASRYGQWFYDQHLATVFVPADIAVGYPTLFAYGLALWWKLTQQSVEASHWLMLPALLGILWQVVRLAKRYVPEAQLGWAVALVLLDPTLLAQDNLIFLY